jgi:hypothetical protein
MVIDTMVVLVTSSGLDTCGDEPIVASRRICPLTESRSGRSRVQSEGGDSVCRPCAPGVHKLAVQPGCTNLGLSALLYSRTNADDDGRIGCS